MGSQSCHECLFVMLIMGFLVGISQAYKFQVGGKQGWVLHPREDYNNWAEKNRFQVNDTLYFKYKKGCDSVLIVSNDDYDSCNTKSPLQSLTDGNSIFKFNSSGPFFFISGKAENCKKGQKLITVVMAVRHKISPHVAPLAPSPTAVPPMFPSPLSPPIPSTPAGSPQTGLTPEWNGPSPAPSKSGSSRGFSGSIGLALGVSFGVSVIPGGLVGLV